MNNKWFYILVFVIILSTGSVYANNIFFCNSNDILNSNNIINKSLIFDYQKLRHLHRDFLIIGELKELLIKNKFINHYNKEYIGDYDSYLKDYSSEHNIYLLGQIINSKKYKSFLICVSKKQDSHEFIDDIYYLVNVKDNKIVSIVITFYDSDSSIIHIEKLEKDIYYLVSEEESDLIDNSIQKNKNILLKFKISRDGRIIVL